MKIYVPIEVPDGNKCSLGTSKGSCSKLIFLGEKYPIFLCGIYLRYIPKDNSKLSECLSAPTKPCLCSHKGIKVE